MDNHIEQFTDGTLIKWPHPGEILLEEFMIPLGLSGNALAKALKVTPSQVNRIVTGRHGVSAEMSLRLGRFFRMGPEYFLDLQKYYELRMAQRLAGDIIEKTVPEYQAA
jgi:addiction module HigA family antidote